MKHLFISLSLALMVVVLFSPAKAEVEIGLTGQTGWSDNKYLNDPNGWGVYLLKSVSPQSAFSFSYNRLEKKLRYIGELHYGFPWPNVERVSEFISSDAAANFYEIYYHLRLVQGSKMRLQAGFGFGWTDFDLRLRGDETGRTMSASDNPMVLGLSVNLLVKQFVRSPFALRLGYQFRTISTRSLITDTFEPFLDMTISSIRASVLVRIGKRAPVPKPADEF